MKLVVSLLVIATSLAFIFAPVAAPTPKAPICTRTGTPERDIMVGTKGPDTLCSLQGSDYLHGDGGKDTLRAGAGPDTLVGAGGRDQLFGDGGDDRLFAVDDRGGEKLDGGAGHDQCFADKGDKVFGCEQTFRGLSLQVVRGLSRTAFDVMVIAEDALSVTPTIPPPVVTVTETKTITVSFPPCTPPPNHTPAPCLF